MFLFEVADSNLIFGFMSETADIFVFGLLLIILAVGLRWIFKHEKGKTTIKFRNFFSRK